MELFDSVKIEVQISGVWVDLTPDVLVDPAPTWNVGIMGNRPLDRVGDPEYFNFYLRNGQNNVAGKLGYYTPGHANALTGWTTGLDVRLYFVYEGGTPYYKYYGKIMPDGINVDPGIYDKRSVMVRAHGFMSQAQDHEVNLLAITTNKRIDEVVPLVVANMTIAPLATSYDAGADTFPTVFDTTQSGTTALGEFNKVAISEFGYVYTKGDRSGGQVLKVEGRNSRNGSTVNSIPKSISDSTQLINENGDFAINEDGSFVYNDELQSAVFDNAGMVEGTKTSYGKNIANRTKAITYPRKIATSTTLFTLQSPIKLNAGETKTGVRCDYRDPNGGASYINADTTTLSTSMAAYQNSDRTGTNYTSSVDVTPVYGTNSVEYTLKNNAAVVVYVTDLTPSGSAILIYDAVTRVFGDTTSQNTNGVISLDFDMKYQNDPAKGEAFASYTLSQNKDPHLTVDSYAMLANRDGMNMNGFLSLEPGSRATFKESMTGMNDDYFVQGYDAQLIKINNNWGVIWSPVLVAASGSFWVLGVSALGVDTTLDFPA